MITPKFLRSLQSTLFLLIYPTLPLKTINHHSHRLIQKLKKPHHYQLLADKAFWDQLKREAHSGEVEKLELYWHKIEPLAHLSAKELISLLIDEVRPLEKYLRYSQALLLDKTHLLKFRWMADKQSNLLNEISSQLQRLEKIKLKVEEAMLIRCEVHQVFNVSYYCDDALGQLCRAINLIQPNIEKHLEEPELSTIADDERIAIFDILKKSNVSREILDKIVIAPIRKKSVKTLINKSIVAGLLRDNAAFIHQNTQALEQHNALRKLFSYTVKEPSERSFDVIKPITDLLEKIGLIKIANALYRYRYLIYVTSTIIIYGALMQFLMPLMMAILSISTISTISSILFFTIGIAPVWYLISSNASNLIQSVRQMLFADIQQNLLDSLILLEKASYFVANQLSQSIVDIPHFDIERLLDTAQKMQHQLTQSANILTIKSSWKSWFIPYELKLSVNNAKVKLIEHRKLIDSKLSVLTSRIAEDISEEMTLLCASADNLQLISSLPQNQIAKLENMVAIYGDEQTKAIFKRNTNIINLWAQKIDVLHFGADIPQNLTLRQPWGGFDIRYDVLNGWKTILSAFITDPHKKPICLRINELLEGKSDYTLESLHNDLMMLNPEQADSMLKSIQWFIFNTLSQRSSSQASLLLPSQKDLINKWFNQHREDIKKASDAISSIFSQSTISEPPDPIPDAMLVRYYELLDSADVYYFAKNKTHLMAKRTNLARQYFEDYTGDNPFAYRLIKFVPKKDKNQILSQVASRRLQWILSNLNVNKEMFDPIDGEMFHNFRLLQKNSSFHFESQVKASPQFNQLYHVRMEKFLIECQNHGFDGEGMLEKYIQRHRQSKQMLQMQLHFKRSARKFNEKFKGDFLEAGREKRSILR